MSSFPSRLMSAMLAAGNCSRKAFLVEAYRSGRLFPHLSWNGEDHKQQRHCTRYAALFTPSDAAAATALVSAESPNNAPSAATPCASCLPVPDGMNHADTRGPAGSREGCAQCRVTAGEGILPSEHRAMSNVSGCISISARTLTERSVPMTPRRMQTQSYALTALMSSVT